MVSRLWRTVVILVMCGLVLACGRGLAAESSVETLEKALTHFSRDQSLDAAEQVATAQKAVVAEAKASEKVAKHLMAEYTKWLIVSCRSQDFEESLRAETVVNGLEQAALVACPDAVLAKVKATVGDETLSGRTRNRAMLRLRAKGWNRSSAAERATVYITALKSKDEYLHLPAVFLASEDTAVLKELAKEHGKELARAALDAGPFERMGGTARDRLRAVGLLSQNQYASWLKKYVGDKDVPLGRRMAYRDELVKMHVLTEDEVAEFDKLIKDERQKREPFQFAIVHDKRQSLVARKLALGRLRRWGSITESQYERILSEIKREGGSDKPGM